MDEKQRLELSPSTLYQPRSLEENQQSPKWHPSYMQHRDRSLRRLCIAFCLLLAAAWMFRGSLPPCFIPSISTGEQVTLNDGPSNRSFEMETKKVSLEAHIMSKCPDAKACLQNLVVPALERAQDQINFRLSFIGSVDPHSDAVACKHGPSECLGNMILLCAAQVYPEPKLSLGFANCLIEDYHDIPQRDLVETCAMEHGLDFEKINHCISEEGRASELLRKSVERSNKANIRTSCTIRLEQKIWCVTDEKKNCNDGSNLDALVEDIQAASDKLNS